MDKKEFDINNMTISSTIVKNVSKWKENVLESAVESWNRNRDKNQEWFPMTDILLHDKGEYKNALVVVPFANDQQKSMMMKCLKEFCIEFKAFLIPKTGIQIIMNLELKRYPNIKIE